MFRATNGPIKKTYLKIVRKNLFAIAFRTYECPIFITDIFKTSGTFRSVFSRVWSIGTEVTTTLFRHITMSFGKKKFMQKRACMCLRTL